MQKKDQSLFTKNGPEAGVFKKTASGRVACMLNGLGCECGRTDGLHKDLRFPGVPCFCNRWYDQLDWQTIIKMDKLMGSGAKKAGGSPKKSSGSPKSKDNSKSPFG